MSYSPLKNEDSLSELFSTLSDAIGVSNQVKKSIEEKNIDSYELWLRKLKEIDPNYAYFWCIKNISNNKELWQIALKVIPKLKEREKRLENGFTEYII